MIFHSCRHTEHNRSWFVITTCFKSHMQMGISWFSCGISSFVYACMHACTSGHICVTSCLLRSRRYQRTKIYNANLNHIHTHKTKTHKLLTGMDNSLYRTKDTQLHNCLCGVNRWRWWWDRQTGGVTSMGCVWLNFLLLFIFSFWRERNLDDERAKEN